MFIYTLGNTGEHTKTVTYTRKYARTHIYTKHHVVGLVISSHTVMISLI